MKFILKTATVAAAAIALTAGTAFARDLQPVSYMNAHGQYVTFYRHAPESGATIGFFGRGRGVGEKKMMWQGRELTKPEVMHDSKGRAFVVFRTNR